MAHRLCPRTSEVDPLAVKSAVPSGNLWPVLVKALPVRGAKSEGPIRPRIGWPLPFPRFGPQSLANQVNQGEAAIVEVFASGAAIRVKNIAGALKPGVGGGI